MPHALLEYSSNLSDAIREKQLTKTVHNTMITSGLFEAKNIKTRSHMTDDFYVGTDMGNGSFLHIGISILEGRSTEQKQQLSESLMNAVQPLLPQANSITIEIRDMDKISYRKSS